jgi:putative ABC transport system substrate-binding protein
VALAAAIWRTATGEQQARIPRVGMLYFSAPADPFNQAHVPLFRLRMAELGYVDGKTVMIEERFAEGSPSRLSELAQELVASNVDVIVTQAVAATRAARQATTTVPIVMMHAGNPVEAGLIQSLSRPGGNLTGTANILVGGKLVGLLHELLPRLQKLALLINPTNPGMPPAQKDIARAAEQLGVELLTVPATRHDDLPVAFETIRGARPDALLVLIEPMLSTHRRELIDFAAGTRIPMLTDNGATAREGGLMSYGSILLPHYTAAAEYVDRILKGAKPGELPVQQPTKFELIVNLRTARQTGIAIPQSLLVRADEVIQ